jgi:hypothetical protein
MGDQDARRPGALDPILQQGCRCGVLKEASSTGTTIIRALPSLEFDALHPENNADDSA